MRFTVRNLLTLLNAVVYAMSRGLVAHPRAAAVAVWLLAASSVALIVVGARMLF